jgi:hypothetical protein
MSGNMKPARCAAVPQQRWIPGASKTGRGGPSCQAQTRTNAVHALLTVLSAHAPAMSVWLAGWASRYTEAWRLIAYANDLPCTVLSHDTMRQHSHARRTPEVADLRSSTRAREVSKSVGMCVKRIATHGTRSGARK